MQRPSLCRVFPKAMPKPTFTDAQRSSRYGIVITTSKNHALKATVEEFVAWRTESFRFDRDGSIKAVSSQTMDTNIKHVGAFLGFRKMMGDKPDQPSSLEAYMDPTLLINFFSFLMWRKVSGFCGVYVFCVSRGNMHRDPKTIFPNPIPEFHLSV